MTGSRGPLSKPNARRRNAGEASERIEVFGKVTVPQAPKEWHPFAKRWFRSLRASGQSKKYEPSDWAYAVLVGELISKLMVRKAPSAELAGRVDTMMDKLGTTIWARQRMRMEIERRAVRAIEDEQPADLASYRSQFGDVDDEDEDDEGEGE